MTSILVHCRLFLSHELTGREALHNRSHLRDDARLDVQHKAPCSLLHSIAQEIALLNKFNVVLDALGNRLPVERDAVPRLDDGSLLRMPAVQIMVRYELSSHRRADRLCRENRTPDAPRDDVRLQTLIRAVEPPAVRVVNDE